MERSEFLIEGTVVRLGRVVIPSSNTPVKSAGSILVPSPRWRYKGPAKTITLTYQVGRWGVGFAGDTAIVTETINQSASDTLKEFTPTAPLRGVALTGLGSSSDNKYDMEMWFKATGMDDQGAIFTDCCEVPPTPTQSVITELTIVNPNKSTWIGGIIYITAMFKYVGPAITGELYAAIGDKDTWFYEKWKSGWVTVSISAATSQQTRLANASINIVGGSPGTYDIYAKIRAPGVSDVFSPVYLDTITITL